MFEPLKIEKRKEINFLSLFSDVSPTPEEETLTDFDIFDNNFLVVLI